MDEVWKHDLFPVCFWANLFLIFICLGIGKSPDTDYNALLSVNAMVLECLLKDLSELNKKQVHM